MICSIVEHWLQEFLEKERDACSIFNTGKEEVVWLNDYPLK
jgi:hypothetical protein